MNEFRRPDHGVVAGIFALCQYVSVIVIIFYAIWGWLAIHSASIAATHFPSVCNGTYSIDNISTFMFFNANSIILGLFSTGFLAFALMFYFNSLLKVWKEYKAASKQDPSSSKADNRRDEFFKHLVIEVVGTYAAIYLLNYLHENIDKHKYIPEYCDGNWIEQFAHVCAHIRYVYACLCAIMTYLFAYVGILFCTLGLYQSSQNWRVKSDEIAMLNVETNPAPREERSSQNDQGFQVQISGNFHVPINANSRSLNVQMVTNESTSLSGTLQLKFNGGEQMAENNNGQLVMDDSENAPLLDNMA